MSLIKTAVAAAILGCLAQMGVRPSPPQPNGSAAAVTEAAERFFATIRSDVASGLQARLKSREVSSRDLDGIVLLLNSCTVKLREAGFAEKLDRAAQQAGMVQTQVLAALKDPGNKEIFAVGLEPERCSNQIKLQKASGAILENKIERLRKTIEELRKCVVILEAVTPPEQLGERIKLRLTQLLSEWREGTDPLKDPTEVVESGLRVTTSAEPENRRAALQPSARERPVRKEIILAPAENFNPWAKVVRMTRERVSEKLILKYIAGSREAFGTRSADQILNLREHGVSSTVIAAMLRHDDQLRESATWGK